MYKVSALNNTRLLYKAASGILRVKQAGSFSDFWDKARAYSHLNTTMALGSNGASGFEVGKNSRGSYIWQPVTNANTGKSVLRSMGAGAFSLGGTALGGYGGYKGTKFLTDKLGMNDSKNGFVRGLGKTLNVVGGLGGAYLGHRFGGALGGKLLSGATPDAIAGLISQRKNVLNAIGDSDTAIKHGLDAWRQAVDGAAGGYNTLRNMAIKQI